MGTTPRALNTIGSIRGKKWLRTERNAPDTPPEYVPPKRPGEGEQMSLI